MSVHSYIGARYVPVWYVNSDDQTANWQVNVEYEPLTFVTTLNNHLYLSKKNVPDNIGNPADNTEYWLDMGSFTGSFQDLQDQIDAIVLSMGGVTQDISDLQTLTTAINTKLTKIVNNTLIGKQIAVYGDSWADPVNPFITWVDYLSTYSGVTVHNNSVNGRGFGDIDTAFDNFVADVYIIEAGINDWNVDADPTTIASKIQSIITKIRAVAPEADIIFTTPIRGLRHQPNYPSITSHYPLELYRQIIWHNALMAHCMVASGLKMDNVFVGDGLHPTAESAVNMGIAIVKAYESGGDSRDFNNELAYIDSSNTIFCLAYGGEFRICGTRTVTYAAGVSHIDSTLYNMNKCFLNIPNTYMMDTGANDGYGMRSNFDTTGIALKMYRMSDGGYNNINGAVPSTIDLKCIFYGTVETNPVS